MVGARGDRTTGTQGVPVPVYTVQILLRKTMSLYQHDL